jgi:hypothetical protein
MRTLVLSLAAATLALCASSGPAHAQRSTIIQPFGNGYIANTPGQPPTTIQPFGNGAIMTNAYDDSALWKRRDCQYAWPAPDDHSTLRERDDSEHAGAAAGCVYASREHGHV